MSLFPRCDNISVPLNVFQALSLDFTGHQRLRQNIIKTRGSYSHYNYYLITLLLDTRLPKIRSVRTRARQYICLNTCVIKNRAVSEIHCLNKQDLYL